MNNYYLLPFNFSRISGREVLVNEIGDMLIVPSGTVNAIVKHEILEEDLYKSLVSNFFISETTIPELLEVYASRLRTKKAFLDDFTSLHIFVLTLRCNQNCIYCQASSQQDGSTHCSMSQESMDAAINLMFQSPSSHLTMEFQGGEPSLMPKLLRYSIEKAEEINRTRHKELSFVLCTNCINLTEEILDTCKTYNVSISTSLDGPRLLHNSNRGKLDSYERVQAGIKKARSFLGDSQVSALMTASNESLDYPIEIVDEYIASGFNSIFLRALNPYGLAAENTDWQGYTERFIIFYKRALDYIIELNKKGKFFIEECAAIILRKILTPFNTGFVDLQSPAGVINSVLVYNYDGYVYASDESRMLAEFKDYTFRLGSVHDRYEDIVFGKKSQEIAKVWANECLAGCSDCAIRPYCGADPVRNYSTQNDMYGHRPTSLLCQKNKSIIEYIISLIISKEDEVLPIFKSWLL